eukprot:1428910-Rhodomonas_salina.1
MAGEQGGAEQAEADPVPPAARVRARGSFGGGGGGGRGRGSRSAQPHSSQPTPHRSPSAPLPDSKQNPVNMLPFCAK